MAVGTTVAAFAFTLATGVVLLLPLILLEVDVQRTPAVVALTAAGQVGFAVVGYGVARLRGMRIPVEFPGWGGAGYALGATLVALVLAVGLQVLVTALGLLPGSVIVEAGIDDPSLFLWLGALSVVLVAPVEEFLFRGVVQGTLREAFGPAVAVVGASLLFGSLHLANYTGRPAAVVAGALLVAATGLVLGVVYELTDNLAVPVATHALYNVVLLTWSYLAV